MILFLHSVSHLLVDGVCLAALFSAAQSGTDIAAAVLLYNTLAFSTQCLTGWWVDAPGLAKKAEPFAMLLVAAGYFLPAAFLVRVVLIGLGNSLFHVCGGREVLVQCRGKAAPLGVFVAPGAIGVFLGKAFPQLGAVLSAALVILAGILWAAFRREGSAEETEEAEHVSGELPSYQGRAFPLLAVSALSVAVAVRAIGGICAVFPWNTGLWTAAAMTASVFAGKTAGGFVCDRLGPGRSGVLSVVPASLLIAFAAFSMPASLTGQFLLNLTMPVTLWLLYKLMPDEPGFAFGLAASALWPGTLIGQMIPLTGSAQKALILGSFVLGLAAIVYAVHFLRKGSESK